MPTLELPDRMVSASRRQYKAVHRYLMSHWWVHRREEEPLVASLRTFLEDAWSTGKISRSRLRLCYAIARHHWRPAISMPHIVAPRCRRDPSVAVGKVRNWHYNPEMWHDFVPRHLRAERSVTWWRDFVYTLGPTPLRRNLIRSYVSYAHGVLVVVLGCTSAADFLRLTRRDLVAALWDAHPQRASVRRLARIAVNHFLSDVVLAEAPAALRSALHVGGRDLRCHGGQTSGEHPALAMRECARDHFDEKEVSVLLAMDGLSTRDRLVLRLLAETGLRRRAVAWLTRDGVYDATGRAARETASALEKGLVVRSFACSIALRADVEAHIAATGAIESPWLFPSPQDPSECIGPATVNNILRRACRRARIHGRHVHCHAHDILDHKVVVLPGMRKFVVCRLMRANNSIESVSKFLGHRAMNTTFQTYWDVTAQELVKEMNIPWLQEQAD